MHLVHAGVLGEVDLPPALSLSQFPDSLPEQGANIYGHPLIFRLAFALYLAHTLFWRNEDEMVNEDKVERRINFKAFGFAGGALLILLLVILIAASWHSSGAVATNVPDQAQMGAETAQTAATQASVTETPEQEKLTQERGEPIEYNVFYAKAGSTGLPIGKRYRFEANIYYGLTLDSPYTHGAGRTLQGKAAFDDPTQYERFLQGNDSTTHEIVASMSADGDILIHRIE